ncbi:MAG: FHA domain-containing protein [Prevotella sp.]|nr:FHA domain-containing protein [Prevotella sp.]
MSIGRISIGRSQRSDICLDNSHVYASKRHGEIYYDGNQMIYRDLSTNGTMINRTMVKHRTVPLRRGDIILVAGRYQIDWNEIDAFIPIPYGNTSFTDRQGTYAMPTSGVQPLPANRVYIDPRAWNWGAMGVYPFWGLSNGCWWALPLAVAVGWLFPLPNLVFGFFGNRWALQYKQWTSMVAFKNEQQWWKPIGIVVMIVLTLFYLWWIGVYVDYLLKI